MSTASYSAHSGSVSPDEAARALKAIAADQGATRATARPPQWIIVAMSIAYGCLFALPAIPFSQSGFNFRVMLYGVIVAAESILSQLLQRRRTVKLGPTGVLRPWSFAVFLTILIALGIAGAVAIMGPAHNPWWFYVCASILVGAGMYAVLRWMWRSWVRRVPALSASVLHR